MAIVGTVIKILVLGIIVMQFISIALNNNIQLSLYDNMIFLGRKYVLERVEGNLFIYRKEAKTDKIKVNSFKKKFGIMIFETNEMNFYYWIFSNCLFKVSK